MIQARVENLAGVGLFVVKPENPNLFLVIKEARSKRATNKLFGMLSAPFETVEVGETHTQALERTIHRGVAGGGQEELTIVKGDIIIPADLNSHKLCLVQLTPGVWLHAYSLDATPDLEVRMGEGLDMSGEPQWVSFDEVLESERGKNRFKFRPGNMEIVQSYLASLWHRDFEPLIYFEPKISVPSFIFDQIDNAVNQD